MLALCQTEQSKKVNHAFYKTQLAMPGIRKTVVRSRFFISNPIKKRLRKIVKRYYHRKNLG